MPPKTNGGFSPSKKAVEDDLSSSVSFPSLSTLNQDQQHHQQQTEQQQEPPTQNRHENQNTTTTFTRCTTCHRDNVALYKDPGNKKIYCRDCWFDFYAEFPIDKDHRFWGTKTCSKFSIQAIEPRWRDAYALYLNHAPVQQENEDENENSNNQRKFSRTQNKLKLLKEKNQRRRNATNSFFLTRLNKNSNGEFAVDRHAHKIHYINEETGEFVPFLAISSPGSNDIDSFFPFESSVSAKDEVKRQQRAHYKKYQQQQIPIQYEFDNQFSELIEAVEDKTTTHLGIRRGECIILKRRMLDREQRLNNNRNASMNQNNNNNNGNDDNENYNNQNSSNNNNNMMNAVAGKPMHQPIEASNQKNRKAFFDKYYKENIDHKIFFDEQFQMYYFYDEHQQPQWYYGDDAEALMQRQEEAEIELEERFNQEIQNQEEDENENEGGDDVEDQQTQQQQQLNQQQQENQVSTNQKNEKKSSSNMKYPRIHSDTGVEYSVLLKRYDKKMKMWQFCNLQLIEIDVSSYVCFERKGYLGQLGLIDSTIHSTLASARSAFIVRFGGKTKNDWNKVGHNVLNFEFTEGYNHPSFVDVEALKDEVKQRQLKFLRAHRQELDQRDRQIEKERREMEEKARKEEAERKFQEEKLLREEAERKQREEKLLRQEAERKLREEKAEAKARASAAALAVASSLSKKKMNQQNQQPKEKEKEIPKEVEKAPTTTTTPELPKPKQPKEENDDDVDDDGDESDEGENDQNNGGAVAVASAEPGNTTTATTATTTGKKKKKKKKKSKKQKAEEAELAAAIAAATAKAEQKALKKKLDAERETKIMMGMAVAGVVVATLAWFFLRKKKE
jgi:hypothetical protein